MWKSICFEFCSTWKFGLLLKKHPGSFECKFWKTIRKFQIFSKIFSWNFKRIFPKKSEKYGFFEKSQKKILQKTFRNGANDIYLNHLPCSFKSFPKNIKKYQKKLKNFWKKYWHFEKYMIYYMSARRKGAKNNGPWKLNNNK